MNAIRVFDSPMPAFIRKKIASSLKYKGKFMIKPTGWLASVLENVNELSNSKRSTKVSKAVRPFKFRKKGARRGKFCSIRLTDEGVEYMTLQMAAGAFGVWIGQRSTRNRTTVLGLF